MIMVKRLLYNELCIEEYAAKTNHTEADFWLTWEQVFEELMEIFATRQDYDHSHKN